MSIKFTPRWEGAVQGHAINTIRSFYPRLAAEYEFEDLLQDAYLIFMRCKRRTCFKIDNPRWFMTYFSNALSNKLINMTKCSTRNAERYIPLEFLDPADEPAVMDEGFMRRVLQELPARVRHHIGVFLNRNDIESWNAYQRLRKLYPDLT